MKTLDKILWDLYSPNVTMEDFLMAPNQHLPERSYPCKDCGRVFGTAEEFSDHFLRDGLIIVGCKVINQARPLQVVRELPA
jgi:hypothetical protein